MLKLNFWKILFILILFFSPSCIFAAEGDLSWFTNYNPINNDDYSGSVAVDSTGVYQTGSSDVSGWHHGQGIIKQWTLNGGVGAWEKTTTPFGFTGGAGGVVLDNLGVYVISADDKPGNGDYQWIIDKFDKSGNLIWKKISNPTAGTDQPTGIIADSSGVYIIGYESLGAGRLWRIEKRDINSGNLIGTFGSGGVVKSDPTPDSDYPSGIAIDSNYMYISGYQGQGGANLVKWRIEKRSLTSGNFDPSFGSGGIIIKDISAMFDILYAIDVDSSGFYVSGCEWWVAGACEKWHIEKWPLNGSAPIWTQIINTGGPFGPDTGLNINLKITSNSLFTFATKITSNVYHWRIEKRDLNTGNLDIKFKNSGILDIYPPAPTWSGGMAINNTGLYIAGMETLPLFCLPPWPFGPCTPANLQWRLEKRELSCRGPFSFIWTDNPLVGGATSLNSVHFNELANAIDTLRADAALPAVSWSYVTNSVSDVQFNTLRAKLEEVYTACGQPIPVWTGGAVTNASPLKASQVTELRNAIANAR